MSLLPLLAKGAIDLRDGLAARELWGFLGWQDIRQRYRRTILGPWWLAISTAVLVLVLGAMWSEIFGVDARAFLPFFAIGYVLWLFLSGVTYEACSAFTQFEKLILLQPIPFSAYLYRIGMRHAIVLAHNATVVALIFLWVGPAWSINYLYAIPGLIVFGAVTLMTAIPVAILCTRFRDLPQIVANVLQVGFFATPIMWRPEALTTFRWVADFNPVTHLIDIVREPLMGARPAIDSWTWSLVILGVSIAIGAWLLGRYAHRVAYWL